MKIIVVVISLLGFLVTAQAEETIMEKAQVPVKDATRAVKKGANRSAEAVCGKLTGDSKIACLAKKSKNRAVESKDVVKDSANEMKNKIDSDKK